MLRGASVRIETAGGFAVERKMITRQHRLDYERARCTGCDICHTVCPQQAIRRLPGTLGDGRLVSSPAIEVDAQACSYCGECVALCPTHALCLAVDGEARLPVVEMDVFPRLEQEVAVDLAACRPTCDLACQAACRQEAITVDARRGAGGEVQAIRAVAIARERCTYCGRCAAACPEGALAVRRAWRGRIRLAAERCPAGCRACADLCPTAALAAVDGRVALDERFCIYCGACRSLCPGEGALTVLRSGVRHAPLRSGAWYEALEKLVSPIALALELDASAQARRRRALTYLPGAPHPSQGSEP